MSHRMRLEFLLVDPRAEVWPGPPARAKAVNWAGEKHSPSFPSPGLLLLELFELLLATVITFVLGVFFVLERFLLPFDSIVKLAQLGMGSGQGCHHPDFL